MACETRESKNRRWGGGRKNRVTYHLESTRSTVSHDNIVFRDPPVASLSFVEIVCDGLASIGVTDRAVQRKRQFPSSLSYECKGWRLTQGNHQLCPNGASAQWRPMRRDEEGGYQTPRGRPVDIMRRAKQCAN